MPPTVSQDTTQSLWDPTLGSPGHPGSGKIQLIKFSLFSSQFCLTELPKPPEDHLVRPQNPSAGSLRATKCLDASYSVPRHHTITMGLYLGAPRVPWVRQNPTCKIFTIFQPNLPCKTAKTATIPCCATPKPVCGGPCGRPSAWMPPIVSQDAAQSLWDPTMGSPGHPGSSKIEKKREFHPFRGP